MPNEIGLCLMFAFTTIPCMPKISFQIFIAARSNRNGQLVQTFEEACAAHFRAGSYEVTVIDLSQEPQLAEQHRILATPTVLRNRPAPERRVIGSLTSDGALQAVAFLTEDLNNNQHEKS